MAERPFWNGLANEQELLKKQPAFQDQSETHLKYWYENILSGLVSW